MQSDNYNDLLSMAMDRAVEKGSRKLNYELAEQVRKGVPGAEERMIVANLPFAMKYSKQFYSLGLPIEDVRQATAMALIYAVRKYDPDKGFTFPTYAIWWIDCMVDREAAKMLYDIKLPANVYRDLKKVGYRRSVGVPEDIIFEGLSLKPDSVAAGDAVRRPMLCMDSPLGEDDDNTLHELIGTDCDVDKNVILRELAEAIEEALNEISPRERNIIERFFGLYSDQEETLVAIGKTDVNNITRERVRQIKMRGLEKIRENITGRCGNIVAHVA